MKSFKQSLNFIDFCAGIGAGRLALEKLGLQCAGFAEIDLKAENTYRLIFGNSEINFGNVMQIIPDNLPNFDLMIAGFPCQTFSIMGERQGLQDDRGQIIFGLINILIAKKVKFFILENVKGLINHKQGETLKILLNEFDKNGYKVFYKVLNSIDFGVPQMRERVYFVGITKDLANSNDFIWPKKQTNVNLQNYLLAENTEEFNQNNASFATFQKYLNNKYNQNKFDLNTLLEKDYQILDTRQSDLRIYHNKVPTLRHNRQGILYTKNGKLYKLSGLEALLLQGFDKDLSTKLAKQINSNNLLAQAGNAMTVNVIEAIGKQLLKNYEKF